MPGQIWIVLGGSENGGILVREGSALDTPKKSDRLATGSTVREIQVLGDRLNYVIVSGIGPARGWVSIYLRGKPLLSKDEDSQESLPVRLWAISDVHSDMPANRAWIQNLDHSEHANDVLILAGDISHKLSDLSETLSDCLDRFARVFFVPGNHDLWLNPKDDSAQNSIAKLHQILALCRRLGVEVMPGEIVIDSRRILVVPILAWHHPQWDTEPDIEGWSGVLPADKVISDYFLTKWPATVAIEDGSAAREIDAINDTMFDMAELLRRRSECEGAVSFSHFVPRVELNPEKRYLVQPNLAKAIGSTYLKTRVNQLQPDVHIFGHTHFGYDIVVDGVRYLQAPLAYPNERSMRATTVALSECPEITPKPCLVWDSTSGWAPRYNGAWSDYSARYGRRPDVTSLLPSYVANNLKPSSKTAEVGWLAGRMPVWLFGPRELRKIETAAVLKLIKGEGSAQHSRNMQLKSDSQSRAQSTSARSVKELLAQGQCKLVDIRSDTGKPLGNHRIPGSTSVPHPSLTETFPDLPDSELLSLCESVMANEGPLVILGDGSTADLQLPAILLASLLRLWPSTVMIVEGGIKAWLDAGGEADVVSLSKVLPQELDAL